MMTSMRDKARSSKSAWMQAPLRLTLQSRAGRNDKWRCRYLDRQVNLDAFAPTVYP